MSMELRMLLAIVLSFVIFFIYQVTFVKKPQVYEVEPAKEGALTKKETSRTNSGVKVLEETPPVEEVDSSQKMAPGRTIKVSTGLYVTELEERKGAFKTFKLKEFRETLESTSPMKELFLLTDQNEYTPVVSFSGTDLGALNAVAYQTPSLDVIDATRNKKDLSFTWASPEGVKIIKTYSFAPDTYEIGLEIKVRNLSSETIQDKLTISLKNGFKQTEASRYSFSGPAALINSELEEVDPKDIADEGSYSGTVSWVANEDQYFASAIVPEEAQKANIELSLSRNDVLKTTYVDPAEPVLPKTERTYRYKLYFGPKSLKSLRSVGSDLGKMLDFGFFDVIAKPLLYGMHYLYRVIPNYGIAIIIITIIVKILFWPLSNKSYKSMSQMKRLQPKMAELRAKYKNDKKMMNQELMNLYKIYKVNPLGGCLPMVLQIPVFFAFYKMLYQAIELRHAPFLLWINDLAAPDRLFHLDIKIPLMAPPYGIPVLTIIMGASMFFQQKMSPPPGDPAQAKMMMFMPIFFTFIFINFPSGLVLYWLVNNILSMAQQYYINKKMA
jgi:YidC/Oxa1 family membrane protein insertase